jgi:hypothetical protein
MEPVTLSRRRAASLESVGVRPEDSIEVAKVGLGATLGGAPRDLDLDDLPRLEEIVSDASLERLRDGACFTLARRVLGNEDSLAVANLDLAEKREAVQCLAQRRSADSERLREIPLGRDSRSGRQLPNGVEQPKRDGLRQLLARSAIELERLCRRVAHQWSDHPITW